MAFFCYTFQLSFLCYVCSLILQCISYINSQDFISRYYHNKYQKSQASGYVNHYAAGERLIGLTEKQLKEHLESLVKATPKTKGMSCVCHIFNG